MEISNKTNPINKELINTIRLIRTPNIGPVTFYKLIEQFGSATNAINYIPKISKYAKKDIKVYSAANAQAEIDNAHNNNAVIIDYTHPNYPPLLKQIEDAPPVLFAKGNINLLKKTCVSIVGARNSSINGKSKAYNFANKFGENGFVVVSGLAKGIDTATHEGSLQKGTIAVLGTGIDVYYPKENQELQNKIATYGCLITETPFTTQALASNFPKRNRIIAGISRGVLVIEAGKNSGSLITAQTALLQNREVFAIPGDIDDGRSTGSNNLIKQGLAMLVQSVDDVIQSLKSNKIVLLEKKINIHNNFFNNHTTTPQQINQARELILNSLTFSKVNIDTLLTETKLNYNVFTIALLELEISGLIQRTGNNCIVKISNQ